MYGIGGGGRGAFDGEGDRIAGGGGGGDGGRVGEAARLVTDGRPSCIPLKSDSGGLSIRAWIADSSFGCKANLIGSRTVSSFSRPSFSTGRLARSSSLDESNNPPCRSRE